MGFFIVKSGSITLVLLLCLAGCGAIREPKSSKTADAATASTATPASTTTPSAESLTIDFAEASSSLTDDALAKLDGAARLYRDARPEVMFVSGHSDKTGDEFSNLLLSARRAVKTKQALVDRGIPAEKLQIVAIGEAEPVPTIPAIPSAVITWR